MSAQFTKDDLDEQSYRMKIDGQEQMIPASKLMTLLFHDGNRVIESADERLRVITPEDTLAAARILIEKGMWGSVGKTPIPKLWPVVFGSIPFPSDLSLAPTSHRHVVGLIALVLGTIRQGKVPFVRYPETYLHPSQQLGLGELFLLIATMEKS